MAFDPEQRALRRQLSRQRYRIRKALRDLIEEGYGINPEDIEDFVGDMPEVVTEEDIENLRSIKKSMLREEFDVPDDITMALDALYEMLSTFNAYERFGEKTSIAQIVQEQNDTLLFRLENTIQRDGKRAVAKRVADNYERLVSLVSTVQAYRAAQGEITEFISIIDGSPLSFKENMKFTEKYNDSEAAEDIDYESDE